MAVRAPEFLHHVLELLSELINNMCYPCVQVLNEVLILHTGVCLVPVAWRVVAHSEIEVGCENLAFICQLEGKHDLFERPFHG